MLNKEEKTSFNVRPMCMQIWVDQSGKQAIKVWIFFFFAPQQE